MTAGLITASTDPVIDVGREEARRAAREELSKQIYAEHEPGWMQRLLTWLTEVFARAFEGAAGMMPGGGFGLLILLALLIAAGLVIRWRLGPMARRIRPSGEVEVFGTQRRSSREHREAAQAAAAAGNWNTAVREAFRGMVADLTERTVLEDRPGRTANETADELAARAPEVAAAARVFDEVSYGDRTANQQTYETVIHADSVTRGVRVG